MIKVKSCEVCQQIQFYDTNDLDIIEKRIKDLTNLKKYAFIIHDKDILDNGEPKQPHFHIVLTFTNATTSTAISKTLQVPESQVEKIRTTTKSALLYLVHRNDLKKFQYLPEQVRANFDYVDFCDGVQPKTDLNDIATQIDNGTIKAYNIFEYITIQDYANHKTFFDRCFEYRQNKIWSVNRNMECIYITGASGTGKTTQAKLFATNKGYKVYISSGGKNPLDNYKGEECIILDDLRDSTYTLTDFLKLTDNNTNSLVGCRFYNKSIAECKMLIVTSVKPIEEFYKATTEKDKEPQQQLFRRFKGYVKMDTDFIYCYYYDNDTKTFLPDSRARNPVSLMYNKEIQRQFAKDFFGTLGLEIYNEKTMEQVKDIDLLQDLDNVFKVKPDNNKSN